MAIVNKRRELKGFKALLLVLRKQVNKSSYSSI